MIFVQKYTNSQDFQKKIPKIFNSSIVFMRFYAENDIIELFQVNMTWFVNAYDRLRSGTLPNEFIRLGN